MTLKDLKEAVCMLTALKQCIDLYKYKLFYIDFSTMNTLEVNFEFLGLLDMEDVKFLGEAAISDEHSTDEYSFLKFEVVKI